MPSVLHVIVTDNFAGAERYVATLSRSLVPLGWDVSIVGGAEEPMRRVSGPDVNWLPGRTMAQAWRSIRLAGRFDVYHAHMTYAEAVAVFGPRRSGAPVLATRHFASARGSSLGGRLLSRPVASRLSAEIAISEFVARSIEAPPAAVLLNGVPTSRSLWRRDSRTVLVMQRLEAEKQTDVAIRAWAVAGLASAGWKMRVVGAGTERDVLETLVHSQRIDGVEFAGWVSDVTAELSEAAMLLATAPQEPLGLSVLEGMAAGVPVVAAAGGGHLETVGLIPDAPSFAPGDVRAAAEAMRRLADDDELRERLSERGSTLQRDRFTLEGHASDVARVYAQIGAGSQD